MSSLLIKAICAIVASILAIALVVVFTILVYQEFAQSPKEYENERRMEKYDDDGGCAFRYLVGNGICDDESNIQSCDFDGGDCCGIAVITRFCQDCQCYDEHGNVQTSTAQPNDDFSTTQKECPEPWLTGNGNCDPENDNYECDYDGGDCKHQGCPKPQYIGDGECDLDNYIPECNFDGEDCKYNVTQSTTKTTTTTTMAVVTATATVHSSSKASDSPSTSATSKNPSHEHPETFEPTSITDTMSSTVTTSTTTQTTTQRSDVLEGDSICDDELNNAFSNYDGGDCCSGLSSYDHCQQCSCRQKVHMNLIELYPSELKNYFH